MAEENEGPSLDQYEEIELLGHGANSIVKRMRRKRDGKEVAIKVVEVLRLTNGKDRTEFENEVKLFAMIRHPRVVQCLSYWRENNDYVIELELADNGDLAKFIKKTWRSGEYLTFITIWKIFHQVCEGLQAMHEKRIMHRDIKPGNVLLNSEGGAKLGDLGLGRYFSSKTTVATSVVGTPLYMAPEMISNGKYDFRADIWSLGCLLYEMIMFKPAFIMKDSRDLYRLSQKILKCEYEALPDDVHHRLREVVEKTIVCEPEKRMELKDIIAIAKEEIERLEK
mmetsp:Transcript_48561/g.126016  ORF Transcript_48561/g.126016 Transcript_48561/m.126016 type:complete len:281 (-) Transcript_48561:2794-3636(-)